MSKTTKKLTINAKKLETQKLDKWRAERAKKLRQANNDRGSCVIRFKGKYDSCIYVCNNSREMELVALNELYHRYHSGNYYYNPEKPNVLEMTKDQINALPEGNIKTHALERFKYYERDIKEYESDLSFWNLVQFALKNRDGIAALDALISRSDAEYEKMEIEYSSVIDLPKTNLLKKPKNAGYLL